VRHPYQKHDISTATRPQEAQDGESESKRSAAEYS
jgi:hypothetical protein